MEVRRSETPTKFPLLFSNFNQITVLFTKCFCVIWTPEWNSKSHHVASSPGSGFEFRTLFGTFFCAIFGSERAKNVKMSLLMYQKCQNVVDYVPPKKIRSLSTVPSWSRFHSTFLESCHLVTSVCVLKEVNSKTLLWTWWWWWEARRE